MSVSLENPNLYMLEKKKQRENQRSNWWECINSRIIMFFLVLLCFSSPAFAKKIEIIQAQRLEFRNVTTPDGKIEEYVTITGKPAIVRIEKDELEANRIEFNKTNQPVICFSLIYIAALVNSLFTVLQIPKGFSFFNSSGKRRLLQF